MNAKPKAILSWSSGKDSAFALHAVRASGELEVTGLLTTVTDAYGRVSMHGVREEILDLQAARAGLPLTKVRIPAPCPDAHYERAMADALAPLAADGVTHVVFGDLYLEDIRAWREARLALLDVTGVFPLWGRDTAGLARDMIASGVEARIVCLDPAKVDPGLAGHAFDEDLLSALGPGVDPCGENGEFHTVVTAGPFFEAAIATEVGPTVARDGFVFTDIRLKSNTVIGDNRASMH
jgi:uncharacterized protein (TIGR00290 family)